MASEAAIINKLQSELNGVRTQIRTLNEKKKKGSISPMEKMQLGNLAKLQDELIGRMKHYM